MESDKQNVSSESKGIRKILFCDHCARCDVQKEV